MLSFWLIFSTLCIFITMLLLILLKHFYYLVFRKMNTSSHIFPKIIIKYKHLSALINVFRKRPYFSPAIFLSLNLSESLFVSSFLSKGLKFCIYSPVDVDHRSNSDPWAIHWRWKVRRDPFMIIVARGFGCYGCPVFLLVIFLKVLLVYSISIWKKKTKC